MCAVLIILIYCNLFLTSGLIYNLLIYHSIRTGHLFEKKCKETEK